VKDSDEIMMRYLLGELSEPERAELERQYFADSKAFDRLERFEHELIDSYARGRLPGETRALLEAAYLSNPARRERLRFGEALAAKVDQSEPARSRVSGDSRRRRVLSWVGFERPAFAFSMALVLFLLASGSVWLLVKSSRLRAELARRDSAETQLEQQQAELQRRLADEEKREQELAAELERALNSATPQTPPGPVTPAYVTLFLTATGVRGAETAPPARLVIPKGTQDVRVQLTLKDHDYIAYQVVLQTVGGLEILNRRNVKPRINKSGATFSFSLSATKLNSGDYMLTLRGAPREGDFEDVSVSLFHVERQ
jgi:hypothetical protein